MSEDPTHDPATQTTSPPSDRGPAVETPARPAPSAPWTWRRALSLAVWPVGIVVGLPFVGRYCGTLIGYGDVVMAQVNACPRATGLLGSPITEGVGLSCGTVETEDGDGHASWRMPVSGPRGSGVYHFDAVEKGHEWMVASSSLDVGDEHVDVRQCAFAARGEGVTGERSLRGRVAETTGPAPVARDATCLVTVGPGVGPFGCRVVVSCGGRDLYGATPHSGFTRCTAQRDGDGREAVTALDRPSDPMSDPNLDLHTAIGEVLIDDRRGPIPWTARLRLDDAPTPAP